MPLEKTVQEAINSLKELARDAMDKSYYPSGKDEREFFEKIKEQTAGGDLTKKEFLEYVLQHKSDLPDFDLYISAVLALSAYSVLMNIEEMPPEDLDKFEYAYSICVDTINCYSTQEAMRILDLNRKE